MAYGKHTWMNGELITAEKLNNLEDGLESVEGTPGPAGPQGPKGDKGAPGEGLTGTAAVLAALATDADAATMLAKINEIVGILNTRGISKAE